MRPHIAESARFEGSRVRGAWVLKVHPLYRSARTLQLLALMARTFDELDAWQLANELKLGVYKLTEKRQCDA